MEDLQPFLIDDTVYRTRTTRKHEARKPYVPEDPGRIQAAIPGVIRQIRVKAGQSIRRGESLLVLEAMKMKNDVGSPIDGEIEAVLVEAGQMVAKNQLLIQIRPA